MENWEGLNKNWVTVDYKSDRFSLSICSAESEAFSAAVSLLLMLRDCALLFLYLGEPLSFKLLPNPRETCLLHPLLDPSSYCQGETQSSISCCQELRDINAATSDTVSQLPVIPKSSPCLITINHIL